VPICLDEYGNTSSASIPITIVTRLSDKLGGAEKDVTCCGYGVGLSWGTLNINFSDIKIPDIILMSNDEKDMDHLA
jgi:3-oxoacyl-[acyl-carrier-protein] synthase-3